MYNGPKDWNAQRKGRFFLSSSPIQFFFKFQFSVAQSYGGWLVDVSTGPASGHEGRLRHRRNPAEDAAQNHRGNVRFSEEITKKYEII